MRLIALTFLIGTGVFFASCGVESECPTCGTDNSVKASFSDMQAKVFTPSCALSGCHVTNFYAPNLNPASHEDLTTKELFNGLKYIEPGDPDKSYLYQKIIGSGSHFTGEVMPKGAPQLSQAVKDSIRAWILNGAPNN